MATDPKSALSPAAQAVIDRHDRYMVINVGRYPIVMERGRGVTLYDSEGKEYLDLFAGFGGTLLGHCHPDLVEAVNEQAGKLWFAGNLFHTEPQTLMAEAIARHGFDGRSFFCHSGADANEAAIKLARLFGQANPGPSGPRYKVISATRSFHGRTFGAMTATGQERVRAKFDPLVPGFDYVPYNDLPAIERAIDDRTVAVMLEPIQGEGGVNVPGDDFLPRLRKLCDERKLVLIIDEVWTGGGRTGKWFAHQHWGITPDIMTLAKGVGGGLPVGVMCARAEVADLFHVRHHGGAVHATTLGGNCLSMAVGAKVFEVIERDGLTERAEQLGRHAISRLQRFAEAHPVVKAVRGKGLFLGVELDLEHKDAWFKHVAEVVNRCMDKGVLVNGAQGNVLRLAPAMVIDQPAFDRGLDVVEAVLQG